MSRSADIIVRLAGRLPISPDEMIRFTAGLDVLVEEMLRQGEDVELMTLGTLKTEAGIRSFVPHTSLLPDTPEERHGS
ncbi:MAG: hypothetical protein M5R41_02900 [Bacteroidia bacterium]|nr:hypothetical protein [Bacteroidia bacterium]